MRLARLARWVSAVALLAVAGGGCAAPRGVATTAGETLAQRFSQCDRGAASTGSVPHALANAPEWLDVVRVVRAEREGPDGETFTMPTVLVVTRDGEVFFPGDCQEAGVRRAIALASSGDVDEVARALPGATREERLDLLGLTEDPVG